MTTTEYQVTEWGHPEETMRTSYGEVSYKKWLFLECDRWDDKWRRAYVRINSEGLIALFTESDEMRPVRNDDPKPQV